MFKQSILLAVQPVFNYIANTGLGERPEIIPALPSHSQKPSFCYKYLPQCGFQSFGIFVMDQ